ncbi:MAG TPA: hypothetical protein VGN17_10350 [Bryobacteraceae bacterium]
MPSSFAKTEVSSWRHEQLLRGMQRLRAKLYLEDGAIRPADICADGSHRHPDDMRAWHLLSLSSTGEVRGCARYLAHPNTVAFAQLGVRSAALSRSGDWGLALRAAIDAEVRQAKARGISFVEVGGWALDPAARNTREALRIALGAYSLARVLGGCIGITTATVRHCSAAILRRIGGRPLRNRAVELPSYYDPQYSCDMEVLRFDSTELNPRFESWVNELCGYLQTSVVIQRELPAAAPASASFGLGRALVHAVQ